METLTILAIAYFAVMGIMFLSWLWAVKVDNYSIVDAVWAYCFLIQAGIFYYFGEGFGPRKMLLLFMIGAWSLRLGFFLTKRIYGHHPEEDTRYKHLRSEYGDKVKERFLLFYFYQAISVSILTLPFVFIFQNTTPEVSILENIAAFYWLFSVCGEGLADQQMSLFKKMSKEKPEMGRTCNIGLWKYSRHPNYFFESNIWWAYYVFMLASGIWWGIYAPLIILFLLLKVTGVPPSEAQSLKSRGDEYREYQRKTSMFIPWFPKK